MSVCVCMYTNTRICMYVYIYIYIYVCVSVCGCAFWGLGFEFTGLYSSCVLHSFFWLNNFNPKV